jgi:hypothetical protein
MRIVSIAVGAMLLVGCASTMNEKASDAAMGEAPTMSSVREFAGPESFLGPIPTAVVILNKDQRSRNEAFCSGFLKVDAAADAAANSGGFVASAIATRWPLTVEELAPADQANCMTLIDKYDFDRADEIKAAVLKSGAPSKAFEGVGPFIIEFLPDGQALVMSGSDLPSQVKVREFASRWTTVGPDALTAGPAAAAAAAAAAPGALRKCNIRSATYTSCSAKEIAAATAIDYAKERLPPEVAIFGALGEALACAQERKGIVKLLCPKN